MRLDERLREFDFGAWEGLTWPEIVATRPHLQSEGWSKAALYEPEGGETFAAVRERVAAFLTELQNEPIESAVIVTHAGPLHAALEILGIDAQAERGAPAIFSAASVTEIAMEGGRGRLITLSDVEHLDSPG